MPPEVLSELRDLHVPDAPGWWPPAPGWWLMALLALALATCLHLLWKRRRHALAPLKHAIVELEACNRALESRTLAPMPYLDRVNDLLKRLLIFGYGENHLAGLSSDAWTRALLEFLRRFSKSKSPIRLEASLLGEFRYRPHTHRDTSPDLQSDLQSACERLGQGLKLVLAKLAPPQVSP